MSVIGCELYNSFPNTIAGKTVFLCIAIIIDIFGDSALIANPKKPPIRDDSGHV